MKQIRIVVRHKGNIHSWIDTTKCPDDILPEIYAKQIIDNFNNTLRPKESPRELVGVIDSLDLPPEHDWGKQNLVTIMDRKELYDIYKCKICGIAGKRFGLGSITRDKKFQSEKFRFCKKPELEPILEPKLKLKRIIRKEYNGNK